jgi:hypothetical protein
MVDRNAVEGQRNEVHCNGCDHARVNLPPDPKPPVLGVLPNGFAAVVEEVPKPEPKPVQGVIY